MLAFIHVAKTGGKSIETMLESSFGIHHVPAALMKDTSQSEQDNQDFVVPKYGPDDFRRLKKLCPLMQSIGGHSIALWSGLHEVQDTTYFAFLREPIKRGASHYQYHLAHDDSEKTWEQWVDYTVHHNHQVKLFSKKVDVQDAIEEIIKHKVFIGFTEKFDESLVIFKKLYAPKLKIAYTRTNTASSSRVAKDILSDDVKRQQLAQMYDQEIPLYEWALQEYYPKMVKEYGPSLEKDVEEFRKARYQVNRFNIKANHVYQKLMVKPFL